MSFDEEYLDPHGECAHEIARLKADNERLLAENAEMRRTFGSHPLFDEQREKYAKIAEGFVMTGPSPIGPLHGAGWSDAATRIATAIRNSN